MADRDLLVRKVQETFPATDVADVLALLEEQPEMRVQLAVVKNASGNGPTAGVAG